jgi:hypothetical protein
MAGALDSYRERLERHFAELATFRAGSRFPIFALEHDLSETERSEVAQLLKASLRSPQRLYPNWLLWVIYATEQGYGYKGHEYWVSFEHNTPGWRGRGRPELLRTYFSRFQKAYGGVVPSGPWADFFKNIAWPITHAVLPQYLQLQFARALYDGRHEFARMRSPSAAAAGKLLASHAWDASSRFQEFLEQEELVGRLVLALLGQGAADSQGPLYAKTLDRIVSDLENVRQAGEWLRAARRTVADRMVGTEKPRLGLPADCDSSDASSHAATALPSVRPSLLLRRSSTTSWSVVMEVPTYDTVARLSADLTRFLRSTRCTLAGTDNAMLPAGWALYGPQRRVVRRWPSSDVLMISFERPNATLENIINGECRFSKGPLWVFHIGSDGIGRELSFAAVRPGQRYIVVSRQPINASFPFAAPARVECEGTHALALTVPEAVTQEETAELNRLGLQVTRRIRVWPAGMNVRNWDGEGHGEWLSTETPCFGIVHDHAVDEYNVRLGNEPETRIAGGRAGQPIFLRVPPLMPGRHLLSVRARRVGLALGQQELRDLDGRIEIRVRDPQPWKPGTTSHSGLAVTLDPPVPSLDDFWEGNVRVSVMGPEGRDVTSALTLQGREGETLLAEEIGSFNLPIFPSNWTQRFRRFTAIESHALQYLGASRAQFAIRGEELGTFSVQLERDAKPIRWICRAAAHAMLVRLIDDTGAEASAAANFFSFQHPARAQPLDLADATADFGAEEPGGLFCAAQASHRDALVVSASRGTISRFQDLLVEPDLTDLHSDLEATLGTVDLWHEARLAGPLAESRRGHIVECLVDRLYLILCGSRWNHAEKIFRAAPNTEHGQQLIRAVDAQGGFAVVIQRDYEVMSRGVRSGSKWFSELAARYGVCNDPALATFALRVASSPFGLSASYGAHLSELLRRLQDHPALSRGARFVAMLSATADQEHDLMLLPRWVW